MKFLQLMLCILAFELNAGDLVKPIQPFYGDYTAEYQIVNLLSDNYFKAQVVGQQYAVLYARKKDQDPLDFYGNVVIKGKKESRHLVEAHLKLAKISFLLRQRK